MWEKTAVPRGNLSVQPGDHKITYTFIVWGNYIDSMKKITLFSNFQLLKSLRQEINNLSTTFCNYISTTLKGTIVKIGFYNCAF